MPEFKPFKAIALASDWKTEMAELGEWVPLEYEQDEFEPPLLMKNLVAFFTLGVLLKMRGPR
jgi:hypothetical protein